MPFEFTGRVIPFHQNHLLVYGPDAAALGLGEPLFGPPVSLRPGYRFYTREEYLLPSEVIDDLGQRFAAPECYEWIERRGDAFPRSDMVGRLASTGEKYSAFMRELDLVEMAVFGAPTAEAIFPLRVDLAIEALASPDGFALTPTRLSVPLTLLSRALPCYRLAPGVFGALGAAIITQLLASRRWDWKLTFDEIDDLTGGQ